MPTFRTILVAADFSLSSREAFRLACFLARKDQSRLLVCHIAEPLASADGPVYFGQQSVAFSSLSRPQNSFESLNSALKAVYPAPDLIQPEYATKEGDPADELIQLSRDGVCDLIVMGTHGRTGLSRLLTGSVAEQVTRQAACPVITLRSHHHIQQSKSLENPSDDRSRPESEGTIPSFFDLEKDEFEPPPVRCILHPTDFSESSKASFGVARTLARQLDARLIILHVIPLEGGSIEVPPTLVDRQPFEDALEVMKTSSSTSDPGLQVSTLLRDGNPVKEVLNAAQEFECDLIVMGTHGRRGLGRLLMGSVAEQVLRRSECPVLTIKPCHTSPTESSIQKTADHPSD